MQRSSGVILYCFVVLNSVNDPIIKHILYDQQCYNGNFGVQFKLWENQKSIVVATWLFLGSAHPTTSGKDVVPAGNLGKSHSVRKLLQNVPFIWRRFKQYRKATCFSCRCCSTLILGCCDSLLDCFFSLWPFSFSLTVVILHQAVVTQVAKSLQLADQYSQCFSGVLSVSFHANNASGKKPDHFICSFYEGLSSIRYFPSLLFLTLDSIQGRYLFLIVEGYCSGVFQTGTAMQSMVSNHMIQISNYVIIKENMHTLIPF